MQIDTTSIQAEVYAVRPEKYILYVKVSIPSLRMYINSCTVRPSAKFDGLWFQMPAFRVGKKWLKPVEFSGDSELLDLIQDSAMRAADQYIQEKKLTGIFPGSLPVGIDGLSDGF